jgi:hypothetical protein
MQSSHTTSNPNRLIVELRLDVLGSNLVLSTGCLNQRSFLVILSPSRQVRSQTLPFNLHQSSYRSVLYSTDTENTVK